ncbi:uncharacterized protein EI90DRAFT_3031635 [Cantharellus anzutake]|uniref:uncharacterized protein n=1 Tax=Cantharellus anzutake TaxID=1750568 RepID=UPI0019030EC5|nr:uncharacterized protein EI90DRAFT_3031635 [Cantharellus anzutake]KAF8343181.1 hypothetical protein EI90DRAFT_3031635 [Cantharellus anzutake]
MSTSSRTSSSSTIATTSSGVCVIGGGDLAALGFAGISAPRHILARSQSQPSLFVAEPEPLNEPLPPPPPYRKFSSEFEHLGFGGVNWSYSERLLDDVQTTTYGEVIKAKLRYKLHKLRRGKNSLPWDVFLNKNLREGEVPWAPKDSPTWKLTTCEVATCS